MLKTKVGNSTKMCSNVETSLAALFVFQDFEEEDKSFQIQRLMIISMLLVNKTLQSGHCLHYTRFIAMNQTKSYNAKR